MEALRAAKIFARVHEAVDVARAEMLQDLARLLEHFSKMASVFSCARYRIAHERVGSGVADPGSECHADGL